MVLVSFTLPPLRKCSRGLSMGGSPGFTVCLSGCFESLTPRLKIAQKPHTQRLLSGSFLGLPYRILNMNHKKELLRSLWI